MKARPTLRRLLGLLLSLVLMAGILPTTVFAAGMPFTDVKSDAWYYNDVKNAYEGSLINGKSATTFEPDTNLTYAEAVKLAACMHQKSTVGSVTLKNGDPWYQSYVDYCKLNGIISKDYNWNAKATRAGYMEIFANALPATSLKATNSVADGAIPDVPATHPQAEAIYKLYRAGILQGVDKTYRCNPDANIKRSEVATILTRMMNEEGRLTFTIGAEVVAPLQIVTQPEDYQMKSSQEKATFSIEIAGGTAPYEYTWSLYRDAVCSKNYVDISSKKTNSAEFEVSDYDFDDCNQISVICEVKDVEGDEVSSREAIIKSYTPQQYIPLKITTQPKNVTTTEGGQAELTVAVTGGTAPYTYEWQTYNQDRWADLGERGYDYDSDGNTICLTASKKTWTTDGPIRCIITDAAGNTVTSDSVNLSIEAAPLTITTQPKDVTTTEGGQVELTVKVGGGTAPYTYEWQTDAQKEGMWQDLNDMLSKNEKYDSDDNTICLTASQSGWITDGSIRCVITDAAGNTVTSNSVEITVK